MRIMQTRKQFFLSVAGAATVSAVGEASPAGPKVLLVVAHPDDEYAVAATVYRITHELGGTVDQFIITNGEGGFRYSQLAESVYRVRLTDEATGRSRLPQIRRRETLEAGRILGIRKHFFLGQRDSRFNTDATEPLNGLWDRERISTQLHKVLSMEAYDYVFTLLPTAETHGHHQAAAFLALKQVELLPEGNRPVVLGAQPAEDDESIEFKGRRAQFTVRRNQPVAPKSPVQYSVIVNWVIAAHKSQGLFQTETGKHQAEQFWTLKASASKDASELFSRLTSTNTFKEEDTHANHVTVGIAAA